LLEFSLNISHSHVHGIMKKIGFILKKIKLEHKSNTCYDKIKDINCLDETSLSSLLTRKYGYSKKRKRCVIQTNN